jgi:hypothetical protein
LFRGAYKNVDGVIDLWVAEVHLLAGGLYLAASSRAMDGTATRLLAGFGALTVVGFATPMLPVLFARAPVVFRVPPLVYLAASLLVLVWLVRGRAVSLGSRPGEPLAVVTPPKHMRRE